MKKIWDDRKLSVETIQESIITSQNYIDLVKKYPKFDFFLETKINQMV